MILVSVRLPDEYTRIISTTVLSVPSFIVYKLTPPFSSVPFLSVVLYLSPLTRTMANDTRTEQWNNYV